VVVVGAGVGGLTAAWLLGADPSLDVLLLESTPFVGGKLRAAEVAGVTVDVGAEAMLNRRPEGVQLARELGLGIVHPTSATSRVWTRGELRPLPRTLLGVPLDVDELERSGMLTPEGLAQVRAEPSLPPTEIVEDVSVATLVGHRLGDEVVDRLVEPLLGGVYAGHARLLSARATTPGLVALLQAGSLLEGAAAVPTSDAPVFAGLPGGMSELTDAMAGSGRFRVRTGATVRELRRTGSGFEMVVGSTRDAEVVRAASVVLATPAPATARLLHDLAPRAAAELAGFEHASMAVVTLAFPVSAVAGLDESSGFLVPPLDGRRVKAATFSFAKWDWIRQAGAEHGVAHLRTSLGRHGEEQALQATDEELVARSLADLEKATGLRATPVDTHVQRWGGGLPQYLVGHLDRVARIKADVAAVPGLEVCGAAYDGVGIPAVIASARRAVEQVSVGH
jgi:oxygen-dependent protoporphyrinogen oxidase